MKGPGLRIVHDVRRVWKCPQCGRESRTGGNTVSQKCRCQKDGVFMRLIVDQPAPPEIPDVTQFQREPVAKQKEDDASNARPPEQSPPPRKAATTITDSPESNSASEPDPRDKPIDPPAGKAVDEPSPDQGAG